MHCPHICALPCALEGLGQFAVDRVVPSTLGQVHAWVISSVGSALGVTMEGREGLCYPTPPPPWQMGGVPLRSLAQICLHKLGLGEEGTLVQCTLLQACQEITHCVSVLCQRGCEFNVGADPPVTPAEDRAEVPGAGEG